MPPLRPLAGTRQAAALRGWPAGWMATSATSPCAGFAGTARPGGSSPSCGQCPHSTAKGNACRDSRLNTGSRVRGGGVYARTAQRMHLPCFRVPVKLMRPSRAYPHNARSQPHAHIHGGNNPVQVGHSHTRGDGDARCTHGKRNGPGRTVNESAHNHVQEKTGD